MLTTFGRAGYLRRAMEAGARGFIVKDAPAEQLADVVRRVAAGERVVDPALAAATLAGGSSAADRPRARRARRGPGRGDGHRHRGDALPVRGHGAQLPVGRHRQDRDPQPHRGDPRRRRAGLALAVPVVPVPSVRIRGRDPCGADSRRQTRWPGLGGRPVRLPLFHLLGELLPDLRDCCASWRTS